MYLWGAISRNMETFDEENPRQRGLRKLLWDIRLIAVIVIGGICYASFEIWNRVFDARLRDMTAREQSAMNRDVANFLSDSTAAGGRTETVRWVNLTIEDIIITSKHPQQLRVEESLVSTDEASISPDDIQNQTSETTAGEGLIPPHLRTQRHRLPHDSDVDADDDEADVRHWSFRASLQGTKRVSLLAHYQLNNRWALESGLSYGHLKTGEHHNSCLAIPVTGFYKLPSLGPFHLNALGGVMFEKVCKGDTPLQFMLRGGVDVEYPLSKKFSVFVEPTLRYHIGNDKNIPELYGNRLGLNINLGVTFRP